MSSIYLVVSKSDPDYDKILTDCEAQLRKTTEDTGIVLSVAELSKGDVMIKVPSTDKEWVATQTWSASVKVDFGPCEKIERIDYYETEKPVVAEIGEIINE